MTGESTGQVQQLDEQQALGEAERGKLIEQYQTFPERIILCIDLSAEMSMEFTPKLSRLDAIKHALKCLVQCKLRMNSAHQIAIMVLESQATVYLPFSSDVQHIINALQTLTVNEPWEETGLHQQPLDLDDFWAKLRKLVKLDSQAGRCYLYRALLFPGRSFSMPVEKDRRPALALLRHGRFFMDVLYIHVPRVKSAEGFKADDAVAMEQDASGKVTECCQDVYELLTSYDAQNPLVQRDIYLECHASVQKLLGQVMMLMAHPLHRDPQAQMERKCVPLDFSTATHAAPVSANPWAQGQARCGALWGDACLASLPPKRIVHRQKGLDAYRAAWSTGTSYPLTDIAKGITPLGKEVKSANIPEPGPLMQQCGFNVLYLAHCDDILPRRSAAVAEPMPYQGVAHINVVPSPWRHEANKWHS